MKNPFSFLLPNKSNLGEANVRLFRHVAKEKALKSRDFKAFSSFGVKAGFNHSF